MPVAHAVIRVARVRILNEGKGLLRAALDLPAGDGAILAKELLHLIITEVVREPPAVDSAAGHVLLMQGEGTKSVCVQGVAKNHFYYI